MRGNFTMEILQNSNSFNINNAFNKYKYFSCDCHFNYRLNIITSICPLWPNRHINDMYLIDKSVKPAKCTKDFLNLFAGAVRQTPIVDFSDLNELFINVLSHGDYIIGLYDTFYMPQNDNFCRVHNYNTFLMFGFQSGQYKIFASKGIQGSFIMDVPTNTLLNMIKKDTCELNNAYEAELLGLPLSRLQLCSHLKEMSKDFLGSCSSVKLFYSANDGDKNCGIFPNLLEDILIGIVSNVIEYNNKLIFSLKCLVDYFRLMNEKIVLLNLPRDLIENNNKIIYRLNAICNLYVKYQYSREDKILFRIPKLFDEIIDFSMCNRNML